MKDLTCLTGIRARMALAVAAGLLLAAAFPKIGVAGFAWVAPGAMLAVGFAVRGKARFWLGYLAGVTHYLASLYWLLNIPVMKLAPIAAWLALSAFLALYAGAWVWMAWRICPGQAGQAEGGAVSLGERLDEFLASGWARRLVWSLSCAALWVAWEMVQARLFTGFPWNFLGASQYRMLPVIQIASVTGVYGVSFLAVWFSVSVLCAGAVVLRRSQSSRQWMSEIAVPLLTLLLVAGLGFRQSVRAPASGPAVNVALVQPSIPQQWIWSQEESSNRFVQLLQLSEKALATKPDLLVWPEAAVPGLIRWDTNLYCAVTNLVRRHGVWLVLGADDVAPRRNSDDPFGVDNFNASFLMGPDGEFHATYRKRRLVIFGEYLPLVRWLPFLEKWTGMGSFTAGREAVTFRLPGLQLKTSVLICFEDVFPHHVREYVEEDTDFLLNLTNNGWFGESAAQWQHAANAVFRAVENGVTLVRCANNGLTCWVTAQGGLRQEYFPGTTDAYGAGFKLVKIPLLGGRNREPTFYHRYGDVFGWACVIWSALMVARILLARRRVGT